MSLSRSSKESMIRLSWAERLPPVWQESCGRCGNALSIGVAAMIGQPRTELHLAPRAYIADHWKEGIFIGESSCCTSALVVRVRHCPLTGWQPFEAVWHIDVAGHQVPIRYCRTQQRSESHYG